MKKHEYSKILVTIIIVIFVGLAVWAMIEYYALVKLAISLESTVSPDPILAVTAITTILGTVLSYILYQGYLKGSLNKNGLTKDPITGTIKSIISGKVENVVEQFIEEDCNNDDDDEICG